MDLEELREPFKKSRAWIDNNPDATTKDLPDDLLDMWREDEKEAGNTLPVQAFLYAFFQAECSRTGKNQVQIAEKKFAKLYEIWQVKLAMIEIERNASFKVSSQPLFSFDLEEQVTIRFE